MVFINSERTEQSCLMTLLETDKYEVDHIPEGASWVIDSGVWLHRLRQKDIPLTMTELAIVLLQTISSRIRYGRLDLISTWWNK